MGHPPGALRRSRARASCSSSCRRSSYLADYLDLVAAIEDTAAYLAMPVVIEGYTPPTDPRIAVFKVTPDPGVIEVNIHPAASWDELSANTTALYELARQSRLGTEKFMLDGQHSGTGGGNHVVIGGPTPEDSPFLRRPDLLRSLIGLLAQSSVAFLSALGLVHRSHQPTSRVSTRRARTPSTSWRSPSTRFPDKDAPASPRWLADRVFRHLLTDLAGNTHRAEFCIDKLYSPDCVRIAPRPGGAARLRDASARANEPHATTAGAGADGAFLGKSVPPKTGLVGNQPARPLHAASLCATRLGGCDGGPARGRVRVPEQSGSPRTSSFAFRRSVR